MWQEFKDFISQGNVMDLAVGVIIGGAFSAIVTALVDNIIMPIVGVVLGGLDFSNLAITVGSANIMYGAFIQAVVDFLIIAAVLFLIVKSLNTAKDKLLRKTAEEKVEEEEDEQIVLLKEIRDLLKK